MEVEDHSHLFNAYLARGGSIGKLFQVDPEKLATLYAYACQRYEAGDVEGARQIYLALVAIDSNSFEYWLATGICLQQLQRHDEAIYCFSRSAVLRLSDPRSSYLAAVSFQILGEQKRAIMAYSAAIKWCAAHEEHKELRARATQSMEALMQGEGE
jgi:secretion system chaperone SscA